jgi:2-polyprenyl-6-methoxyphenol hydroxylase-like FAD-dependent oxidoreductase
MAAEMIEVPVLVAGGGPVGLTMAVELAHYGIECLLVERNETTTRHPKMDLTNGRCMELFRRTGLADRLRAVGVPESSNYDVIWTTDLKPASRELHRFCYPSNQVEYWRRRTQNDGTLTREAPLRVSQILIEPEIRKVAEEKGIDLRFSTKLESFVQDDDGVTATIVDTKTGQATEVRAKYLLACDGGNSTVRSQLGIESDGRLGAAHMYLVHFRSTAYDVLHKFGQGWHYQCGWGQVVAQDDRQEWTLHCLVPPDEGFEKIDPRKLVTDLLGTDFEFEVLVANPVTLNYQVAHRYSAGRTFLVGDAAHQFVPTGGYGMNSGIAEVANLSWKVAAVLNGWGGEALLESYHHERQPISYISKATSERHLGVRAAIYQQYEAASDLDADTEEAERQRLELGRRIAELGNGENEAWGTEHGYRYDQSPVIPDETGYPPAFDMMSAKPSTWPGSRLPSMFLADGSAVYDRLGKWFTLLVLEDVDTSAIETAAARRGVPLKVVRIDDDKVRQVYEKALILVRPDNHVAWRGDELPDIARLGAWRAPDAITNPDVLLDRILGR